MTTTAPQTKGRFTLDEIAGYAEMRSNLTEAQWTLFVKTLDAEETEAIQTAINVNASARILEVMADKFVADHDDKVAADFIASLPEFANVFCSLVKSAVVKDGRGGSNKRNRKHGEVSFAPDGHAKVSMLSFPVPSGTLRIVHETETNDEITTATK